MMVRTHIKMHEGYAYLESQSFFDNLVDLYSKFFNYLFIAHNQVAEQKMEPVPQNRAIKMLMTGNTFKEGCW